MINQAKQQTSPVSQQIIWKTVYENSGTTQKKHCLENGCLHEQKDTKDMIRCTFCFVWYHYGCVDVSKKDDDFAIWPCPLCRSVSRRLEKLSSQITSMESAMNRWKSLLTRKVVELTTTVNKLTWSRFNYSNRLINNKCALIGSSMIRDISESKLVNTTVTTCLEASSVISRTESQTSRTNAIASVNSGWRQ